MGQGFKPQPRDGYEAMKKRLDAMQAEIDSLRGAASIRNSIVSNGGETIYLDEDGNQVVKLGHDSFGARGMALTSLEGTDMLDFFVTGDTGLTAFTINDRKGNNVLVTDPNGDGTGMYWPWVPIPMADVSNTSTWPANTTGSFSTVQQGGTNKFSQRIFLEVRTRCDGGATAGEVRLLANGVAVGSTGSMNTSVGDVIFSGLITNAAPRDFVFLQLQTRVTAGAGNARAQTYQANWLAF